MKQEEKRLLLRKNIVDLPVSSKTATDKLIEQIVESTTQTSVSKADEIAVMQSMLNDKDFKIAIFDRTKGYVGSRSPRDTAISIVNDSLCSITGMGMREAMELTKDYEFSKRDASRYVTISKDFIGTYMQTGRKLNVVNDPRGEASINLRYVEEHDKTIPDPSTGGTKVIKTPSKIKLNASNKSR